MSDDAWNLIKSGRYDEAAQQLARYINAGIGVALGHFGNKAVAELAAGRLLDAERTFKEGQAFAERDESSRGSNLLLSLSEVQWLNGHVEEAVGSLMSRIRGLKDGSVQFADAAGGGTDGLMLYYYGVRLGRSSLIENAHEWLERVRKRNRLKVWPGPLVRWFFGELDDSAVLIAGCGASSMEVALSMARTDILARRQLIEFCFHRAVRAMRAGERPRSRELFETAVSLDNPLVDIVWYLARREADLARTSSN
jgi:hypothetical protein